MVVYRSCPHCEQGRERELRDFAQVGLDLRLRPGQAPTLCPDCDAPLLLSLETELHFVIQCPACRHIYEARDGRPHIYLKPICPKCKAPPGRNNRPEWLK